MKTVLFLIATLASLGWLAPRSYSAVVTEVALVQRTPLFVGSSTIVDVVLRETRDITDTSTLGTLATISGNIKFTWSGSNSFTISNLLDHGVQSGRFFDNGGGSSIIVLDTARAVGTVEQVDLSPSLSEDPLGTIVSGTLTTLRLASFSVSGGAVGESINLFAEDFDLGFDDLVLEDGTVLDQQVTYGSLSINGLQDPGNVVPEPSSIALFGSLLGGLVAGCRKRSQRRKS
jgi:hypothetical protein